MMVIYVTAVVGIPIYKETLTSFEEISLQQINHIMFSWDKVFIAPHSLKFFYGEIYDNYGIARFDDEYFKSTSSYSDLLLTEEFYKRFEKYRYLLIYQLDAFVFSDRLNEFCKLGYDYIGAPAKGGNWNKYHVGNGGFSLRNISRCLRVLKNKNAIVNDMIKKCKVKNWAEDDFFAFCGWSQEIDFKVPSPKLAATFSAQTDYVHGLRAIQSRGLPFGCHYWTTMNYHFWKPYIEKYGYHLSEVQISHSSNTLVNDRVIRLFYLIKRCMRKKHNQQHLSNIFYPYSAFSIWGAGKFGKECIDLFMNSLKEYELLHIYDECQQQLDGTKGLIIERPNIDKITERESMLIIATTKYYPQIKEMLLNNGMVEDQDYISLVKFYERLYQSFKSN